jgi:two-component system sensor histidine kinase MprB
VSFRRRLTLLAGGAVAVAILAASALAYVTIARELRDQVDDSLASRGAELAAGAPRLRGLGRPGPFGDAVPFGRPLPPPRRSGGTDFYQGLVAPDGTAIPLRGAAPPPVDDRTRDVAAGRRGTVLTDTEIAGDPVRLLVAPLAGGGAIQVARSLRETQTLLRRVRLILLLVAAAGIAGAALLGRVVAGRATEPLHRLERTAEHVAATQDLGRRIDATGTDELSRLAARFNDMLDALERSMTAQRQLVADASHELRTPVTSLRTNLEALQANPDLEPGLRAELLVRATAQTEELTALMNDLIDLARGDAAEPAREAIRLDELVEEAVERAARHAPAQRFAVDLEETTVVGSPPRLVRAVNNLLDNAVRFNAAGGPIEVRLRDGELTVRDHGPGFDPAELAHVFDRFFRGAHARERSGSGLGLAIARQAATSHGGSVAAANAPGGGALLRMRLPVAQRQPAPSA